MTDPRPRKVLTLDELIARRERARSDGLRVVHCHGCFDIVHPGHIRHLRYARTLGDVLLVSITGDDQMRKGTGRPLIPEELRAENLAALDCVDWVHINRDATARDLLRRVQPDVYVKGREYETSHDPGFQAEADAVRAAGGRVVFSSGDVVFSSTALIGSMESSIDQASRRLADLLKRPGLDGPTLLSLLTRFTDRRVVVVGEVIRDDYVFCDRPRVAGESPVLSLRPLDRRTYDGGAAVIALHLAALGAIPTLVAALPQSQDATELHARLTSCGVRVHSVPSSVPIPVKERFLVGAQKVVKVDRYQRLALDLDRQRRLTDLACDAARDADAAIVVDFGLGMCSKALLADLTRRLRPIVGVLCGDVSGPDSSLLAMQGMDALTPSESELRDAIGAHDQSLPTLAWTLLHRTASRAALVKMGVDGLVAFSPGAPGGRLHADHLPALAPTATDSLGAGDALLAAATLALASGATLLQAALLGSVAAGIESTRLGNVPVGLADLRRFVSRLASAHLVLADDAHTLPIPQHAAADTRALTA